MLRGVEQPSWDRLRMATAQTRYAMSGDVKAKNRSAMAKQSRSMQRRWTDAGCEGVALRSRAGRRQSEARHGEGMARQRFDRRRLWNAMQHNGTSWLSGAMDAISKTRRCMAMAWRRDALRSNAKEQQGSVMQRQRVALMRRGVAQPRMAGRSLAGTAPHGYLRRRAAGAWTRACRMAEGPGLRQGRRAVTFSEPPA